MRVLIGDTWTSGYLDATPEESDYVIAVTHWVTLTAVPGLFFERNRSLSMVLDYVRDVGLRATIRRIRSRTAERVRNQRFICVGLGRVLCAPPCAAEKSTGELAAFLAPKAPLCADRVVVPEALVFEPPPAIPEPEEALLLHAVANDHNDALDIGGWDPWSGVILPDRDRRRAGELCASILTHTHWDTARRLPVTAEPVRARTIASVPTHDSRPSAILFGMGNYAKTTILPYVRPTLNVRAIHDLDPLQLGPQSDNAQIAWSTDPRGDLLPYDVVLVAGYHHTHAELAARALDLGKSVVVEKPLATSFDQLRQLSGAAARSDGRLFVCFQRRYTEFNQWAVRDLKILPGDPVHYHCIVFEEPLPAHHWYRWPVSGSRLLSNGCHWIDHFLHLNAYSPPTRLAVEVPHNDVVNVTASLENGAVFTMVLTDVGSRRLGVREAVELRSRETTVRLVDGKRYESEDSRRRLRRQTIAKLDAYRRMYASIGENICEGRAGEPLAENLLSARMALELDGKLRELSRLGAARVR